MVYDCDGKFLKTFWGQVALEGNFRFVLDKSDLKSSSDKKLVRKATVALQNKICEQNTTPCCKRLVISCAFPRSCLYSLFTSTKPRHEGSNVTTKNYCSDCFLLFLGSSAAGKYRFHNMVPVIYAEFTNTKLAIDTTYSLSTKSLLKRSSILLDSSSSSRIVVWDPLHWSDNTRGLPSKAFTNEQRKLWFVAQRNSQPADKTEYNTVKLSHSGKGSCLWFTSPCTWKFVRHNRTCAKCR